MKDLPLSKVYQLLEPGPVVLLTTARNGCANVMTMSWHMMVEFEPPLVGCVVSSASHSFAALRATRECVIAVPAVELAAKVVQVGNCSGRDVDKFAAFGLTPMPAERVAPPLVGECFANLECKVACEVSGGAICSTGFCISNVPKLVQKSNISTHCKDHHQYRSSWCGTIWTASNVGSAAQ